MKVYKNARGGSYSGGMILVAANTKEEAIATFRADPKYHWMHTYVDWGGELPYWDEHYYTEDGWREMPMLTANVDRPQVIAEEGYTE